MSLRESMIPCEPHTLSLMKSRVRFSLNLRRRYAIRKGFNVYPYLNLIFIHIPKTAGSSIHSILAAADETLARTSLVYNPHLDKLLYTRPNSKHLKAYQWRAVMGKRAFEGCERVIVVRNPWDTMVSSYEWWRQKASQFPLLTATAHWVQTISFKDFLNSDLGSMYINEFRGEFRDWYQCRGVGVVEHVIKFENMKEDLSRLLLEKGINIDDLTFPHLNATTREQYRKYYSRNDAARVEKRFEYDIRRFGYSF